MVRQAINQAAYAAGSYSYQQIADDFGVYFATVSRIVRGRGEGERSRVMRI